MTTRGILLLSMLLATSSAFGLNAAVKKYTAAPPAKVWAMIGDFCGISQWHPAVAKCELSTKDGATLRTLTLKDGAVLVEKQTAFDKTTMSYTYTIESGPLPVANYSSTLSVKPKGKGSNIEWTGKFDPKGAPDADVIKAVTGIYEAGTTALQTATAK